MVWAAVLGADSPIGLTIIRELGERGVKVLAVGRSADAIGRYSRFTARFIATDRPVAEFLPPLVREYRISAVLAFSEGHLLQLAGLKDQLGNCRVLTPDAGQLATVLDKERTLAIAARLGIRVPVSWAPCKGEDFARRAAELDYPVAVKWADPNGVAQRLRESGLPLEKVEYAASADELTAILRRYDPIQSWPLVQSWCPGQGLGQMMHIHTGEATLRFQHRRVREWPRSGGISSMCEGVSLDLHREQFALSEKLLREIGWEGPAMVEYRHDAATNTYWLMEVNGRFWGSLPLAHHCGADFAWETWRCGMDLPRTEPRLRTRRARYMAPDLKHLVAVMVDRTMPLSDRLAFAARYLAEFADPRMRYYVWSWRDPLPFLGSVVSAVRNVWHR